MLQLIVVPTFFYRVSDPTRGAVTGKTVMEKTTRALLVLSASLPTHQDVCDVLSSVPGHHCRSWSAVCCTDFTAQHGVHYHPLSRASVSETLITVLPSSHCVLSYVCSFRLPEQGGGSLQCYASGENSNSGVLICISTDPKL